MLADARTDVLIVTVTEVETRAVRAAFAASDRPPISRDGRVYFDLGTARGARFLLTQSEMGSGGLGAAQQAVQQGIATFSPSAVIMVGIAFGIDDRKQQIGDVLVTNQLFLYDLQRAGTRDGAVRLVPRGDKPHASPWLLNLARSAKITWAGAPVHFGPILTGEKLVDNLDFRDQLRAFDPEAIGGEMEGAGLYVACAQGKVDWLLVKAICDWADGNKADDKAQRQALAAGNAAAFVHHFLHFVEHDWQAHRAPSSHGLAVREEAPPARKPSTASSLPRQQYFFGREHELAIVADAIAPESRTWGVLIDGPGGIGKTSLAVRAAMVAPVEDFDRTVFLTAKVREMTLTGERPLEDDNLPSFIALLVEMGREAGDPDIGRLPEKDRAAAVRRALTGKRALLVIDNVEVFPEAERVRLYQFLARLPQDCKAIVTSRRRTDVGAWSLRLDRLEQKDALDLLAALVENNRRLAGASEAERRKLYEATGGNPLVLRWTAGQIGRPGSRCRTVDEACAFLEKAPAGNDPLDFVFGDLLDTFTESETAVLAALSLFTLAAHVRWIADVAGLAEQVARTALEDLGDRALLVSDPEEERFVLPRLAGVFLARKRPEAVARAGERAAEKALALVLENGFEEFERFPVLEEAWPVVAAALPVFLQGENARLHEVCDALYRFLGFSGRWDEWLRLSLQAEEGAVAAGELQQAGWRAYHVGFAHYLLGQATAVMACADRTEAHWKGAGTREQATAIQLRGLGHSLGKDFSAAIGAYTQSLALHRALNPESGEVAAVLNALGGVRRENRDYAGSERDYREGMRIATKIKSREGVAIYTGNLAELALDREDWPEAERLAREALPLAEGLGRHELIGANCHRLAKALARQGKAAEGLPHAQRAMAIFSKLTSPVQLADAQAALAECTPPGPEPPAVR